MEVERKNKKTKNGMTLAVVAELAAYLEGSNSSRSFSPILWWNQQKDTFPTLFKLARRYLSVPGSSVPSEKVFSAAGNIITNKRASPNDETTSMLIFLNANL